MKDVDQLKHCLSTEPLPWVLEFIEKGDFISSFLFFILVFNPELKVEQGGFVSTLLNWLRKNK